MAAGLEHGPEAYLLRAGSGLDVIGARYRQVAAEARAAVLARHPRLGFKRAMDRLARARLPAERDSRVHFLYRYLQFGRRIAVSPFEE